mgnify:CR=1 FL=1
MASRLAKQKRKVTHLTDVDATDTGTFKCVAQSYPTKAFEDEKSIEVTVRPNSVELYGLWFVEIPNPSIAT